MIETIRKFYAFAGPRKARFQKGLVFAVLSSLAEALQILALYVVLKDLVEENVTLGTVWTSFGIMLASILGGIVFGHLGRMSEIYGSFEMCADKRLEIGERLKYMPMGFFNQNSLGRITTAVTNTMEDIQDVGPRVIHKTIHGFIHGLILTIMLAFFDWRIGLIVAGGGILFLGLNRMMQLRSRRISPRRVQAQAVLVEAVLEYIQGMGVVKSFNREGQARQKMNKAIDRSEKMNLGLEITFIPFTFLQSLVLKMVSVLLIAISILFHLSGTMELYNCLLMMIASFMIYSQLETAGSMSALFRVVDHSIDRVEEIKASPLLDWGGRDIVPATFDIRGENIFFSYDDRNVINNVSFSIPQGATTAIVGPSGGGKTTLCNLIARFWDPDEGSIALGGADLKAFTQDSLLDNIAMVFQRVYLFNDTIAANIRFGKPEATLEAVVRASKKACCHDFISALPQGYDTVVGEGGSTLSGGEKQRISLARAILKDAPIIILDEATANVDPENQDLLQQAIEELTASKTVIMIAHRLKTIRHADQILVLDQGRIVQQGTHSELMAEEGIYRDFVAIRQASLGWKITP